MKKIYLLLIILYLTNCEKGTDNNKTKTIEDYLVKNNEISGWVYSGSKWIANSISELTTYIDGAAELYQRYGFIEAVSQQYSGIVNNYQKSLKITIFNQGNRNNCIALYKDPDLGMNGSIGWDGVGEQAQYIRYSGFSQSLVFYRDAFFVQLEIDADSEESLNILKQFAINIDMKMK